MTLTTSPLLQQKVIHYYTITIKRANPSKFQVLFYSHTIFSHTNMSDRKYVCMTVPTFHGKHSWVLNHMTYGPPMLCPACCNFTAKYFQFSCSFGCTQWGEGMVCPLPTPRILLPKQQPEMTGLDSKEWLQKIYLYSDAPRKRFTNTCFYFSKIRTVG